MRDIAKQRLFQKLWMRKRRADWFALNGPCKDCGSWEDMELHHIDPAQKVEHKVWSWAKERREEELAKCEVLCNSCHRKKHQLYWASIAKHGTYAMYNKHKCRCEPCRAANRERSDKQKQRSLGRPPAKPMPWTRLVPEQPIDRVAVVLERFG